MGRREISEEPETVIGKIEASIKDKNYIFSLFLEHSALESYLSKLILIAYGKGNNQSKQAKDTYKNLNFQPLLSLNNILGIVKDELYQEIKGFTTKRNKFVHDLIGIDFMDEKVNSDLKKLIERGLELCKNVMKIYEEIMASNYDEYYYDYYSDMFRNR